MDALDIERLYLRYFDVDLAPDGITARPIAKLQSSPPYPKDLEIVPCIFITNRSIKALEEDETGDLSQHIFNQIISIQESNQLPPPKEVQIDCDWTPSTRERYFALLTSLRIHFQKINCKISCTIRLHQYKYPEDTGVPKVDRGMLMVYNVGNLDDPQEENSIFNLETVRSYVEPTGSYPLQLDVALPIFGWGVLIRDGKPIRLLNNLRLEEATKDTLMKKTSANQVEVLQSHYFYGRYLYAGDKIRFESVSSETLVAGAELIAGILPEQDSRHIALYHLDTLSIRQYAIDTLETVYRAFH